MELNKKLFFENEEYRKLSVELLNELTKLKNISEEDLKLRKEIALLVEVYYFSNK